MNKGALMATFGDLAWLLVCSVLVMVMQAGFLCLETGLTRSKNNINVAVKNLADLGVSMLIFWALGFGLMFGSSSGGWFGSDSFLIDVSGASPETAVFFLFQALFCGTAVTVMSGAVAERLRFGWYLVLAVAITAIVYPVLGHWVWNDDGWLAQAGFVDFAGATVVHATGGWAGLAVILVLGPREGRFQGGSPVSISGSNLPFATLGAILLWCGWIGFNGGSVGEFDGRVVKTVATTTLGGAAGLVTGLLVGWRMHGIPRATASINGLLAGLVAVTASANVLTTPRAVIVGAIGAVVALAVEHLLERRQIDDAVGAVPVHLGAGIWGTIAVALFADRSMLGTELSMAAQLGVQLLGVAVAGAWVFGLVWTLCTVANRWWPLRVSVDAEEMGLNVAEHGASTDLVDLFQTMEAQARTGDMSLRVNEESFTEVGQIGRQYNRVMAALSDSQSALGDSQRIANFDPLTDTLNRRGLSLRLEDLVDEPATLVMFDVVRFGSINGSLGYSAGDEVLLQISNHLVERLGEQWTVGRWGGDEFVAIAPGWQDLSPDVMGRIVCGLTGGGQVTVSVRAGVLQAAAGLGVDGSIRRVSYALDDSKREEQAVVWFDEALEQRFDRSIELGTMLEGDLSGSRIVPVAQTILANGEIVGAELLARWRNDDGTLASPLEFLPALVEGGRMFELDLHMLAHGIAFATRLNSMIEGPWVSVNVSAPSLTSDGLVNHVERQLTLTGLRPDRLIIEITETEELASPDQWLANAHRLRELGVGLAIDDFGSGYSGIERMSVVPITHVKFDRDLVRSIDGPLLGVMRSVVEYAQASGIVPVAEGVETEEQHETMLGLGVEVLQGYLFSFPEPLDAVVATMARNRLRAEQRNEAVPPRTL